MRRLPLVLASGLLLAGFFAPSAAAVPYTPPCTSNTDSWRQQRIVAVEAKVNDLEARLAKLEAAATPLPTPTPTPTTSSTAPSPTPTPTDTPTSTPTAGGFPDASTTGVPAGTSLTASGALT